MYYLCILLTKNRNIMKGNLLQGTARGRMGDIVAKVIHGEQILSKYQPVVFNPDSPAQRRQRTMLSIATKKATFLSNLRAIGVNIYYSNYYGASKSIRNHIVALSTRAQRIKDDGSGELVLPSLITTSNIGNDFELNIEPLAGNAALLSKDQFMTPATGLFFGSDIPLDTDSFCTIVGTNYKTLTADESAISYVNIPMTLTPFTTVDPDDVSLPKTMGFMNTGAAVKGFPYVYSIATDFASPNEWSNCDNMQANNGYVLASWRDKKGNLIIQKSSRNVIS